eukprot:539738-Pyramimonas_sp.AAC.1
MESAQMTTKGPADYAVAVTTAAMRMWGLSRVLCGAVCEPAAQALVRAAQLARDEETLPHSASRRGPKSKINYREQDGRGHVPHFDGVDRVS